MAKPLDALRRLIRRRRALALHARYRDFTMLPRRRFAENLALCAELAPPAGCVVECGVWRGGMSAGMAEALPGRLHYLFDSFEGLPPAQEIDGEAARAWQQDKSSRMYLDNCRAERAEAERAMAQAPAREAKLVQGWFADTVPDFRPAEPIAVLRLDGDWYESTLECLRGFYPLVAQGGLVLVDDYYDWVGCSRAVHDYLSERKLEDRIRQSRGGVCHLVKSGPCAWTAG